MANKNTLEIIIKANSTQAVAALKNLQNTVAKPFSGLQQQVGALGSAFTGLTGISLGAAGAFAALGMAASKASDFIKSSVSETIAYAQSVRELSYVLGINAEETSRIIQVADDYLISTEKLTTALRFAVKNGFEPSIESLAQLADQFNAIADPNERAAKMVEIFGRNWTALVPLLKAGGAAIRENAAAIEDSLVLSDAQTQQAFEYQQAIDSLNDSWTAFKTDIGMALIPVLTDLADALQAAADALNKSKEASEDAASSISLLQSVFGETATASDNFGKALLNASRNGYDFGSAEAAEESLRRIAEQLASTEDIAKKADLLRNIFEGDVSVQFTDTKLLQYAASLEVWFNELKKYPAYTHEAFRATVQLEKALGGAASSTEELDKKLNAANDALKNYANVIQKTNLTTTQQNAAIENYAVLIGASSAATLTFANDMDLLASALDIGAISLQEYDTYSIKARTSTEGLDDATRAYVEEALANAQEGQAGFTNALKGTANAATLVRDQLVNVIGLAEQLRYAGPREVRNQIFDQLQNMLTNIDPSKAEALATGIKDIGLAFGVFNKNDLAIAEAIPQFVEQLGALKIDPSLFAEAVQGFLDAVRNTRMTGEPIDINAILEPFLPDDSVVATISEEWKTALQNGLSGITIGPTEGIAAGVGTTTNPILEQVTPKPEEVAAVVAGYDPIKQLPQDIINAWAAITEDGEGMSILVTPLKDLEEVTGNLATQTGIFATNASDLNGELDTLPSDVETLGKKATGAYQPMKDLATAIGDAGKSADTAATQVQALVLAIAALSDKTVTITANVVLNDPFGLLGGGVAGGNSGAGGGGVRGVPVAPRASGGPVKKLEKYIVGEEGPELFIPDNSGVVVPTDITQAAIIAAGTMDAFGGNRGQTPSERAANQRKKDKTPKRTTPTGPVVSGAVPQPPPGYQFLGENLDAYLDLFQPAFSVDNNYAPEPERRAARSSDSSVASNFGRTSSGGSMTAGQIRRQQQALQKALEQTYQPLGENLFQPQSDAQGVLSTDTAAVATAATETERTGKTVTYNNYFPVQKLEDELDARDLARKVAAELARMPSR